jgi:hypothetical protein
MVSRNMTTFSYRTRTLFSSRAVIENRLLRLFLSAVMLAALSLAVAGQSGNKRSPAPKIVAPTSAAAPALVRTTTRHEVRRLGYGGTLTILGAPSGSITIEAWARAEVDITADIELRADTEADLARLAVVNNFALDEDINHIRVLTTGTHDKAFMRRTAKDFPKKLLGLPWKIDYRIRVPAAVDLEINMGRGAFNLAGVEGSITLTALESDATLALTGGRFAATIGRGSARVKFVGRNWRGSGVEIRLATGNMIVELPANFTADIDASVLRTGAIENTYNALVPRERTTATAHSLNGRAGAGGPTLAFTVGDGKLFIKPESKEQ